jgi:hypothetical protein
MFMTLDPVRTGGGPVPGRLRRLYGSRDGRLGLDGDTTMRRAHMSQHDQLVIHGTFQHPDGTPIPGAAVRAVFLGDPPTNCGTVFDLVQAPAHTDDLGRFQLPLPGLDVPDDFHGPAGVRRRGCFWVMAVQDARTLGFVVATGEELVQSPVRLTPVPTVDFRGRVEDVRGRAVAGARVEAGLYLLTVGRGRHPDTPLNFWLSRRTTGTECDCVKMSDLVAVTGSDGSFVLPRTPAMPRGSAWRYPIRTTPPWS